MRVKLLSRVQLLATPWIAAHQAPPSMGFSRQEYWSGVPLPSPFHLSNLLQMLNDCRMVDIEFFGNFPCKRINFDDGSQLVVVNF